MVTAALFNKEDGPVMLVIMVLSISFVIFIVVKYRHLGISHADNLQNRAKSLGDVRGKTVAEITSVLGLPSSRSQSTGQTLLQWQTVGSLGAYHIAMAFDDTTGECAGITHESKV